MLEEKRMSIRMSKEISRNLTKNLVGVSLRALLEAIATNEKVREIATILSNSEEMATLAKSKIEFSRQLKIKVSASEAISFKKGIRIKYILVAIAYDYEWGQQILEELGLKTRKQREDISIRDILERERKKREN